MYLKSHLAKVFREGQLPKIKLDYYAICCLLYKIELRSPSCRVCTYIEYYRGIRGIIIIIVSFPSSIFLFDFLAFILLFFLLLLFSQRVKSHREKRLQNE